MEAKMKLNLWNWIIRVFFFIALTMLFACEKNNIEDILITGEDEYWCRYDSATPGFNDKYYKFHSDSLYDLYSIDINGIVKLEKNSLDNYPNNTWYTTKDSIFRISGFAFDLVMYNENVILLGTCETRNVFLVKENIKNRRKSPVFYCNKRLDNPDKYEYE
ncbi:hypothetical protein ABS768_17465 [Flavobacterium sp. ST-75]|uniref:DKNYY family protein n=1 Tax=Flavobacterium rhizophilum TaxID=3163296 RepID=A0ABW8YGU7_9FLAO